MPAAAEVIAASPGGTIDAAVTGVGGTSAAPDGMPATGDTSPPVGVSDDFVETYREHFPRVVRALELGGLQRAVAEDVAQEAFARTLGHWRRVRGGTNPAGYVYRVAFRLVRRRLRPESPLGDEAPAAGDLSSEVASRLDAEAVIAAMPPRRRACVVLCLVVGASTREAASALRLAEGTVRKHLERGRADLRAALGKADSDSL